MANPLKSAATKSSLKVAVSPGAVTPPNGDVRTMLCDVSPVPSDVESIDYSKVTKALTERRGPFTVTRPQTLRVGRNEESATLLPTKSRHTYSQSAKTGTKSNSGKVNNDKECNVVKVTVNANVKAINKDESVRKAEVAVRIVPDSAKSKVEGSTTAKEPPTKLQGSEPIKPKTQSKPAPKPTQNSKAKEVSTKSQISTVNKNLTRPAKEDRKAQKTKLDSKSKRIPIEKTTAAPGTEGADEPLCQKEAENNQAEVEQENQPEVIPACDIPADEECCKAYSILNSSGIKVSLHTLRK